MHLNMHGWFGQGLFLTLKVAFLPSPFLGNLLARVLSITLRLKSLRVWQLQWRLEKKKEKIWTKRRRERTHLLELTPLLSFSRIDRMFSQQMDTAWVFLMRLEVRSLGANIWSVWLKSSRWTGWNSMELVRIPVSPGPVSWRVLIMMCGCMCGWQGSEEAGSMPCPVVCVWGSMTDMNSWWVIWRPDINTCPSSGLHLW